MGTSERPRPTFTASTESLRTPAFLPHQLETTIVTAAVGRNLEDHLGVTNRDLLRTVNVFSETAQPVIIRAREILGPGNINLRTLTQHDQTELENLLRPPLAPEPSTGTWPLFCDPFTDIDLLKNLYLMELNAKGHAEHTLEMRAQTTANSHHLEKSLQGPLAEHNLKLGQLPLNGRRPTLVSVDLIAEQMLQIAGAASEAREAQRPLPVMTLNLGQMTYGLSPNASFVELDIPTGRERGVEFVVDNTRPLPRVESDIPSEAEPERDPMGRIFDNVTKQMKHPQVIDPFEQKPLFGPRQEYKKVEPTPVQETVVLTGEIDRNVVTDWLLKLDGIRPQDRTEKTYMIVGQQAMKTVYDTCALYAEHIADLSSRYPQDRLSPSDGFTASIFSQSERVFAGREVPPPPAGVWREKMQKTLDEHIQKLGDSSFGPFMGDYVDVQFLRHPNNNHFGRRGNPERMIYKLACDVGRGVADDIAPKTGIAHAAVRDRLYEAYTVVTAPFYDALAVPEFMRIRKYNALVLTQSLKRFGPRPTNRDIDKDGRYPMEIMFHAFSFGVGEHSPERRSLDSIAIDPSKHIATEITPEVVLGRCKALPNKTTV